MRSLYFRKSIILLVSKVCPPMLEGKFFLPFFEIAIPKYPLPVGTSEGMF